ncbi:MAG: hypothetical protein ABIQ39_08750 [Ilumatobacteraceae bacterium]
MTTSTAAHVSVIADHVEQYRAEVAAMAGDRQRTPNGDAVTAMYEAERSLRSAIRMLHRAAKLSS